MQKYIEYLSKILVIIIGLLIDVKGQEIPTPYYQEPTKRLNLNDAVAFPNLSSKTINYFIKTKAGFKKEWLKVENNSNVAFQNSYYMASTFDIHFGQIRDNNWVFEVGYQNSKFNSSTIITDFRNTSGYFQTDVKRHYIVAETKKKILFLDKVSKAAQINLGGGLSYKISQNQKLFSNNRRPPNMAINFIESKIEVYEPKLEYNLALELKGNLTKRVEIGVFADLRLRPKALFQNKIIFTYENGKTEDLTVKDGKYGLAFGLLLNFKSQSYKKYYGIND